MQLINKESVLEKAVAIPGAFCKFVSAWDIVHAPPVDARPIVHAHWKRIEKDGMYWYACSHCGGDIPRDRYKSDLFSDFCPNCGSEMSEEVEEGD